MIYQAELYSGSLPPILHVKNTQTILCWISKGQLRSSRNSLFPSQKVFCHKPKLLLRNERNFEISTTCETGAITLITSLLYFMKLNALCCFIIFVLLEIGTMLLVFLSFKEVVQLGIGFLRSK